jgi:hypothetical protein
MIIDNSLDFSKYNFEKISNDTKIITVDLESHSQLNDLKITHEKLDTYLTHDDKNFIDSKSLKISIEWYQNPKISKLLKFDDLNLGSLLEQEILVYLIKKFKLFLGLIRLLKNESTKIISATLNVINILKILDETKNFKHQQLLSKDDSISNLNKITIPLNIPSHPINISFSYSKALKIIKIMESLSIKFFHLKLDLTKQKNYPSILFLDLNPFQYEPLLNFLHEHQKQILFLNEIGTLSWKKSQSNILRKTNSKIFQWNDFKNKNNNLLISKNKQIIQSRIYDIFSNENFKNYFDIEGYLFWQIIKDEFITFCISRFFKSLELLELTKNFFANVSIESIIVLYHAALENKVVLHIAEKMNIPCLRLQHGLHAIGSAEKTLFPINFPSSQLNLKHLFWDKNLPHYYSQLGLNPNNGIIVGSPRYDNLFQLDSKNKTGKILLTSTFLQNFASVNGYDSNILDIHKKTFQEICKIIHSISNKKLIIKLHPSMPPKYSIKSILNEIDSSIPIFRTQDITNLLIDSEVVICLDHSTVLLESMILKKPTITFMIDSSWYENDPIITSGATLAVNSLEDFKKSLNNIIFDTNFRNQLIQKGTEYVNNNLTNKGNSSQHLGKLLISKSF